MSRRRLGGLNPKGLMSLAVDEETSAGNQPLQIPGFEIISELGRGAAGAVYEATNTETGESVALKLLSDEHVSDGLQRERIEREAAAMQALSHPNLVTVYDFIDDKSVVGIVMELVRGQTLRHLLREGHEIAIDEAVRMVSQIGSALQVVHDAGLTHRDLKPENILLDQEKNVKVTDFGIAFSEDSAGPRLTLTGMTLGTVGYMSPEQADGFTKVDFRSDIYSLAVVLHELTTGESPDGRLEPPGLYRNDLPDYINEAVVKALNAKPEDRFSSATEFVSALQGKDPQVKRGLFNRFRKSTTT